MRFYKKIFIAFFGLLMITPRIAIGAYTCATDKYIDACKFVFTIGGSAYTLQEKTLIRPREIFALTAWISYMVNKFVWLLPDPKGFLCWDFDDPKNNYDNLRKLFNPTDTDTDVTCYALDYDNIFYYLYIIDTGQAPAVPTVLIDKATYTFFGEALKNACDPNSIPATTSKPEDYCVKCPPGGYSEGGYSEGASHDGTQWTKFSTIADCSNWTGEEGGHKTYDDNTGTFYYSNDDVCHYSGG